MAPAEKGIEDTGATREGPLGTAARDFSEVGELEGGFGFGGRLVLKTHRARGSVEAEGTGYEAWGHDRGLGGGSGMGG